MTSAAAASTHEYTDTRSPSGPVPTPSASPMTGRMGVTTMVWLAAVKTRSQRANSVAVVRSGERVRASVATGIYRTAAAAERFGAGRRGAAAGGGLARSASAPRPAGPGR